MAEVIPVAGRGSPLLAIAAEIRQHIYSHLFKGAQLEVQSCLRSHTISDNILELLKFVQNIDTSILKVCRTTLYEAQTVLAKETTLQVHQLVDRENPLDSVPDWFLSNITYLEIEVDSFVHVQRDRLVGLKQITLVKDDSPSLGYTFHAFELPNGVYQVSDQEFIRSVMMPVLSWEWKKKQFIYLADEEGWALTLKARYHSRIEGSCYLVSHDVSTS